MRYVQSNGAVAIRWVCVWCEDYKTCTDLPARILEPYGVTPEELPKRVDHSTDPQVYPQCVVCGDDALEFHHWAPASLFPEWPGTLGVFLCKTHHDEWHTVLRAHGLRWPHEVRS